MAKSTPEPKKKVFLAKIVMLGDGAVGKTALVHRFVRQSFGGQYKATMGLDLSVKEVEFPEGTVRIQLWDMGGQAAFAMLRSRFYGGTRGAIFVYDLTRPHTLQNLDNWIHELESNVPIKIPCVVLGNKSDLVEMQLVSDTMLSEKLTTLKDSMLNNWKSSAKIGDNVEEAFLTLASYILKKSLEEEDESPSITKIIPKSMWKPKFE